MESVESVEVDLRQSSEYSKYMEKIGWKTVHGVFIRKLGPVSIAKIQRTSLPRDVDRILKENRVFMCKFEPLNSAKYEVLSAKGFRRDNWPLLGTKTLRVDLRPGEEKILQSFKKDCRYALRKVLSAKCKVQRNSFDGFYEIWRKSAKRKRLWIPKEKEYRDLIESFGNKCFCLTINDEAGAVILTHKKTAFYYYAGSTIKSDLPYLAVWEAMKEAKKRGCTIWDFEGIYDSRWPNKGWEGFSHFKKSFGGQGVEFPGSFTRWSLINVIYPFKHQDYQNDRGHVKKSS